MVEKWQSYEELASHFLQVLCKWKEKQPSNVIQNTIKWLSIKTIEL